MSFKGAAAVDTAASDGAHIDIDIDNDTCSDSNSNSNHCAVCSPHT